MKITAVILLVLLALLANTSLTEKYRQFKAYGVQYGKKYETKAVEFYRFGIYLKNLLVIEALNLNPDDSALYGETQFTDLTLDEARAISGLIIPKNPEFKYVKNFTNDPNYKPKQTTPDIWNWVQQGVVGPVLNQGSCGSCWTFSTAGNIQSLNFMKTKDQNKQFVGLSMQQLIDCDKSNFGCNGGWPYNAIDWLSKNGGLMTLADYPLRSNYSGPCQYDESKKRVQVKGYMNISRDEDIIKDALYETGPLSILLDFTGMFHYKSGIANPLLCSDWPDHALVLVGYGYDLKKSEDEYWLIKNSWGPKWGEQGYLRLRRKHNKCGVQKWAVTAVFDE